MTATIQEETDEYVKIKIEQMDKQMDQPIADIYDKEYFAGFEGVRIEQEDSEITPPFIEEKEETFYSRIQNYIRRYVRSEEAEISIPSIPSIPSENAVRMTNYVVTIKKTDEKKVQRLDKEMEKMEEIKKMEELEGESSIYEVSRGMTYIMIEGVIEEVNRAIEEMEKRGKWVNNIKKEEIFNINGRYVVIGMEVSEIVFGNDYDKESNKKRIMGGIMNYEESEKLRMKDTKVYKRMR